MEKVQLSLKNISYSYHSLDGEIRALDDISFSVTAGEFLAIVGPSGCGKSTILSLIAGLLHPESGDITFYTADPKAPNPESAICSSMTIYLNGAIYTAM